MIDLDDLVKEKKILIANLKVEMCPEDIIVSALCRICNVQSSFKRAFARTISSFRPIPAS